MTVPSLRNVSESILRVHFAAHVVEDVGSCPYRLLADLLKLCNAPQLHAIEHNSPHLMTDTDDLWRQLAVKDFIGIRCAVEDGKMKERPTSWRALHEEEAVKQQAKMAKVLERMRGHYKAHVDERATIGKVDGVQLAKRRKLNAAGPRSKSLFQQVKSTARRAQPIFAPKHRGQQVLSPAAVSLSALTKSSGQAARRAPDKSPIKVVTIKPAAAARKMSSPTKLVSSAADRHEQHPSIERTRRPLPTKAGEGTTASSLDSRTPTPCPQSPTSAQASVKTSYHAGKPLGPASVPPTRLLPRPAVETSSRAQNAIFLKRKR